MKNAILFLCLCSITACSVTGVIAGGTVEDLPAARREGLASSTIPALQPSSEEFAFKLYNQLSKQDGNLFFSPASIEAALAMVREGAGGETLNQFNKLLPQNCGFPMVGTNVTLESANAIWADQVFPILGNFTTAVTEKYAADIRSADFRSQPDAERKTINNWVEKKTRDKIKDLLPAGSVNSMTRMILVNAIYFKGDWETPFKPQHTADAPFWISENESVSVPMMRLNGERFRYGETERFQTLELPYEGEEVSMLLILLRGKTGIADAASMLTEMEALSSRKTEVNLFLPRFTIESTFASMKKDLAALGLTDAFTTRADFSGISREPLFISDVVHKAFVEVNEKGTEATAATGLIVRATAMPAPPKLFRADHPFLFLIRENESGNILFMGRISNPAPTPQM